MTTPRLTQRLRSVGLALAAIAIATAACRDDDGAMQNTPTSGATPIVLELSSLDAAAGSRIAVAVRADVERPLGGLQGYVRFDPARLRYVGQPAAGPTLAITNHSRAAAGEIRLLSMNPAGLDPQTAVLVFEVRQADYARHLRYDFEIAATRDGEPVPSAAVSRDPVLAPTLAVPAEARPLTLADWSALLYEAALAIEGPARTPGQYLLNLRYGDVTLNGSINVLDAAGAANAAVGNNELIIGSDAPNRDFVVAGNVRPANLPGLGEPTDANPPGRETNGTRVINVIDALAIANEAVGTDQSIVGELIPGRGPLAGTTINVPGGDITTNTTWTNANVYQLDGIVKVNSGATLTIEPGTLVQGNSAVTTALFIERDGRLVADGTPLQPINFSCTAAPKFRGCWGGVWIAGNAPINTGTPSSPVIPGRAAQGNCLEQQGEGGATLYGGCNATDSSGVLRYVNIEYAGFILSGNNELNGLTMGGVGSATVIDNIQVHAGLDDGVELFGGTVNLKHLLLTANSDDSFDFSFGWSGFAQFIVIQHDSLDADKGFEVDNTEDALTYNALPRTMPQIYNVTFVGRQSPTGTGGVSGNNSNDALHIRRGARPAMKNFVILSARRGLDLDDEPTCTNINTDLQFTHSMLLGVPVVGNVDGDPNCPPYTTGMESNLEELFVLDVANNNTVVTDAGLVAAALRSPFNVMLPDFRPAAGGVVATALGAAPPSNGFFDVTATYLGAVAPANASNSNIPWYSGWTHGWQNPAQP